MRAMPRRCTLALLTFALLGAGPALAQQTRILVGFAAGGSADLMARYLAERLREPLGRTVLVENRVGAAGRIALDALRSAAPDGTTLLLSSNGPFTLFPHIFRSLPYDPVRDFTSIARVARQDLCLSTGPATPSAAHADLGALRAWIGANPARASYGSPGNGSLPHFLGVLVGQRAKLDMVHVPYKGSALAANDLLAGQLPLLFSPCTEVLQHHRAGKVRIVASSGAARSPLSTDVPTFVEQGLDVTIGAWFGLYGPAGMSPAAIESIAKAVLELTGSPAGRSALAAMGIEPDPGSADEMRAAQRRDFALLGEVAKASGFKPLD